MKHILIFLLGLITFQVNAQKIIQAGSENITTTAGMTYLPNMLYVPVIWYTTDTLHAGDNECAHEWLSSEPYSCAGGFGEGISISCLVMHPFGERCSYAIQTRKSICKKCLMHIAETDENPNPPKPIPKPEPVETYEMLLDKIKGKG